MAGLKSMFNTVRELMGFLWHRKLWWLMPMIVVLMIFVVLIILGSTAGVGPFIYTLF